MGDPQDTDADAHYQMECPACGSTDVVAACDGGGYLLLCAKCRQLITCTSWCAVGPEWHGEVVVYRMGAESEPLLRGIVSAIWEDIERLAEPSRPVILEPVRAEPSAAADGPRL